MNYIVHDIKIPMWWLGGREWVNKNAFTHSRITTRGFLKAILVNIHGYPCRYRTQACVWVQWAFICLTAGCSLSVSWSRPFIHRRCYYNPAIIRIPASPLLESSRRPGKVCRSFELLSPALRLSRSIEGLMEPSPMQLGKQVSQVCGGAAGSAP